MTDETRMKALAAMKLALAEFTTEHPEVQIPESAAEFLFFEGACYGVMELLKMESVHEAQRYSGN